ncbi:4-hydroxy-tetrahydrodipicolinate reductase [Wenzhouxiangella limi]|uniref:4-hydroxy-tetrahydrodipicolinate reductase n=1 Tax=Wenzhouxiangella limi TaxID=2707351 RepID=UPI001944372C
MRVLVSGASGAVGKELRRLIEADPELELAGVADRSGFFGSGDQGDVLVDFSHPALTLRCLELAEQRGLPLVIGTTALTERCRDRIEQAATRIPLCVAANFSVGVTVMLELAARAASALPTTFDIEIAEAHHRRKLDAPSGTALALGEAVAQARKQVLSEQAVMDRSVRREPRSSAEIGFQVSRGGDVVGEHSVQFFGDGERLEIVHRATDRSIFARGALLAARKLTERGAGRVEFRDLLVGEIGS